MKKIFILVGHPRKQSFCNALANYYKYGAEQFGHMVKELHISALNFDYNLETDSIMKQSVESDLIEAQGLLKWADHVVFIYPNWWGGMPAMLKGFIDRTFTPGFAYEEIPGIRHHRKLLTGKSARVIITMDNSNILNIMLNRSPDKNAIKRSILHFCGIKPVKISSVAPMRDINEDRKKFWLNKMIKLGEKGI